MNTTKTPATETAKLKPASEFEASGAPHQIVNDVDPNHPAVDNNRREGTTEDQNRIDFNDPYKSGSEVVAENLGLNVEKTKPTKRAG